MPFNIADFQGALAKFGGPGLVSRFEVRIVIPTTMQFILRGTGINNTNELSLFCEASCIPGVMLAAEDVRHYGIGPTQKKPYMAVFTDMKLGFIGDSRGIIHKFFARWLGTIVNFNSTPGFGGSGSVPYELAYPDDYVGTVNIRTFDVQGVNRRTIVLERAYPLFVGDQVLAWEGANQYLRVPVAMTFQDWHFEEDTKETVNNQSVGGNGGAGTGGGSGSTTVNTDKTNVGTVDRRELHIPVKP